MIASPLSDNAITVLKARYLRGNESPEERFTTIADVIGGKHRQEAYDLMITGTWLPNTPTIANAGRNNQLAACFVLPIDDALTTYKDTGIMDIARITALIHQTGGGTGYSFGHLRPAGFAVASSNGVASGPVTFMSLFNAVTDVIKQGGIRRGAMMAELPVDHPDILKFIYAKTDQDALTNFNISVSVTEAFMLAVERGHPWDLRWHGKVIETVDAHSLWTAIIASAWRYGDPGLFFIDTANKYNPLAAEGELFEATNPCGEVPLLPWEPCNLGSINLGKFVNDAGTIDMLAFNQVAEIATMLLDNVVEANQIPIPQVRAANLRTRRLGLGVMGWADMLNRLHVAYDSNEALALAEYMVEALRTHADAASVKLAEERGPYPAWRPSHGAWRRNVAVLSIAPTGSISTIANCSAGIEPYFDRAVVRRVAIGKLHEEYANVDKPWFRTSAEISGDYHVDHSLAWQGKIDNAVSKTVNLPNYSTMDDVDHIYRRAWKGGAKGITIYRNGSRTHQVYNSAACGSECEIPA
jgi:ribonucleoside-diphosphate reductase alpha chain